MILLAFTVGIAVGWTVRIHLEPAAAGLMVSAPVPTPALQIDAAAVSTATGEGFDYPLLSRRVDALVAVGQWQEAVSLLLESALSVQTATDEASIEDRLSAVIDEYARILVAQRRFDVLDGLYERVTFALPELSDYFMKLALLRMRLGNDTAALGPLSQIQNDEVLGAQARQLLHELDVAEEMSGMDQLPLRRMGEQFVVDGVVDANEHVTLLIDTGAAMTILDASLLDRLGYSLTGRREYFATAGGAVDAPVVSLQSLRLGDMGIQQIAVGALSMQLPAGIDGLLGMNFLRHFEFRIDQEATMLYLSDRRSGKISPPINPIERLR